MNWINDAIHGGGKMFRTMLDNMRSTVYNYCDYLVEDGATVEEAHAIGLGYFEVITEGNMLQYVYMKYVEDWLDDKECEETL